jgi:metal-responsive CopG/Arc/MetJ family transcriptional regulator
LLSGITGVILEAMKTAISIPDDEFKKAEELAARLGISRSELYRSALAEFMSKHAEEAVTERLNELYEGKGEDSSMSETLFRMQAESIPEEEW